MFIIFPFLLLIHVTVSCVSQLILCCHRFCKKSLAVIVTGEIKPSGSKIPEVHLRISRLLAIIAAYGLGEVIFVSESVSHHKPRTLTGLVSSTSVHYHPVRKESLTALIRIVYDCSCKQSPDV